MFDGNQIVQVKWNNTNRKWYESKGYVYTKRYDSFDVQANDLSPRSNIKIIAVCDYCGNEFETCFVVLMDGRKKLEKDCCRYCSGKKTSEVSLKKRAKKYIGLANDICKERGYTLLTTANDYTDVKMDIHFLCPKHGEQTMMLDNLIRGRECWSCSYESRFDNKRFSVDYVESFINSINNNILLNPQDYQNCTIRNLRIKCGLCGNEFVTSFVNYAKHGVITCYSCSCKESQGEERIRRFLESHNIKFKQEKRFEDCRDVRPLPFDFYLPEYNMCIEFDGQHHFEEIHNRNNLEIVRFHDQIKDQYCKNNNISLIRIPYWEGNDIEVIIAEKLNL